MAGARRCIAWVLDDPHRDGEELLRGLRLQRSDARFARGAILAGAAGHVLDRVELLAGDEVEPAERFLHPLARALAGLAGHAGESARGRVGELDEVGDQGVFALHGAYLVLSMGVSNPRARS